MIDYNHRSPNERINALIDAACLARNRKQPKRTYLGGSRLGVSCERALQFEVFDTEPDDGKGFSGRTIRIFDLGHVIEELAIKWIRDAGFDLQVCQIDGKQFGWEAMGGRLKGHIDGGFCWAPPMTIETPCLWECKSMAAKKWKACAEKGVAKSHPVYAAQIAVYQLKMDLTEHPAVLTAVNKDTCELHFELVPFNKSLAVEMMERGERVIKHCDEGILLPRAFQSQDHFECRFCSWTNRCWSLAA